MAISGDTKQNYIDLQQSTGERFAHMAQRVEAPEVLQGLDERGRAGNRELAKWLRSQTDDETAVARFRPKTEETTVDEKQTAAQERKGSDPARPPVNRSATAGKTNA